MAVRGWVQACEWQAQGSELVADAALDALLITVEDTSDFDDAGGVVSINDQTIGYSEDAVDDDTGTILLNTGLAAAATVGDRVYAVSGDQIMRDVVLFVSCGDGEDVEVRVAFEQRDYWPEGAYDEPVQVILSDDLERVLDAPGRIPQSTELAEARGGYPGTLQEIYDSANAAAAAAADAAANATTALTAANGKNKVIYSLSAPGSTPNTAGDIWFRKDSATQTIIGQWQGQGGTSWQQVTLNDQVIANLDAGKIVAGSAFTNALSVKTNFTLGDAATNGVIQSYDFAGSSVGVYIDKFGLVAKGGSIAGATITGATVQTAASGARAVLDPAGFRAYNSGGSLVAQISGGIGGVTANYIESFGSLLAQQAQFGGVSSPVYINDGDTGDVDASGTMRAGAFKFNGTIPTTPNAANAYIATDGWIRQGTSSAAKYKENFRPVELTADDVLDAVDLVLFDYREEVGGFKDRLGVVADRAVGTPLENFVAFEGDEVENFDYGRAAFVLAHIVGREQRQQIAAQAEQIADLTARIEALETAS